MKKLLVVLLAVTMLFAFTASALAADPFPDIAEQDQITKDAFGLLKALEVLEGYPDGGVRPDAAITRAEFAKMACVAAGLGSSGDVLKGTASSFSDVLPNEWYTGWVNLAVAQGFVKGYADGTFRPNINITLQEVVTVLLRIAGYNDNLPGPWPIDYISKAGSLGLTDDVNFSALANATRGQVAVLIKNLLDQDVVYWDKDKEKFVNDESGLTVLEDSFKGNVYEEVYIENGGTAILDGEDEDEDETGRYTGTEDYLITPWEYKNFTKGTLALRGLESDEYNNIPTELAEGFGVSGGFELFDLAGMTVTLISETKTNGDVVIKYIDVEDSGVVLSDSVYLEGRRFKIGSTYYNNGTGYSFSAPSSTQLSGMWRVILDDDGYVAELTNYDVLNAGTSTQLPGNVRVASGYNPSTKRLEYLQGSSLNLTNKNVVVIKDKAFADLEDIEKYDAVSIYANECGADYVIVAASSKEGEMDAVFDGTTIQVRIGGSKIKLGGSPVYSDNDGDDFDTADLAALEDYIDEEVVYVPNRLGRIKALIFGGTSDTKMYGVVTDFQANYTGTRVTSLTVFTQNGETVTYDTDNSDGTVIGYIGEVENGIDVGAFIRFRVNEDGEIDDVILLPEADDAFIFGDSSYASLQPAGDFELTKEGDEADVNGRYDKENGRISIADGDSALISVTSGAPIFNIVYTDDEDVIEIDKVELVGYSTLFSRDSLKFSEMAGFVEDGIIKALALVDMGGVSDYNYDFVKDLYTDSKARVVFYNLAGSELTYERGSLSNWPLDDEDETKTPVKKTVLYKYTLNGNKVNSAIDLYTYSKSSASGTVNEDALDDTIDPAQTYEQGIIDSLSSSNTVITLAGGGQYIIDKDTKIYDMREIYTNNAHPLLLNKSDLSSDLVVTIITSDDDEKAGYDDIALFVIVEGESDWDVYLLP